MRNLVTLDSAYLASGWFNNDQERTRLAVQLELEIAGISYYSPKDEGIVNENDDFAKNIFETNVEAIKNSTFLIVNTTGKDMGTLFEAGYASALNIPIIYYFEAPEGATFNLMLAQTAVRVVSSQQELREVLKTLVDNHFNFDSIKQDYKGKIE